MAIPTVSGVAVIAAEQLEKSAGPAAALAAFRPLVAKLGPGEARERAIVGAVRCAVRADDPRALVELAPLWSLVHGDRLALAVELAQALVARGRADLAAGLAAEEMERQPGARAAYLLARCLEAAEDPEAMAAYQRAAALADREEGATDVAYHARVRRVARLVRAASTFAEAVAEAALVRDDPSATPAEQLVMAEARLGASSRFARAAALSTLADLAESGGRALADRAVRLAAEHADAMGGALTALELERLAGVLKHRRDPAERERALARLAALKRVLEAPPAAREAALLAAVVVATELAHPLQRALALVAGVSDGVELRARRPAASAEDASLLDKGARLADLGLDAIAALRRGEPLAAESILSRAADGVRPDLSAPAPLWTAARLGLASPRRGVEGAALRLVAALLGSARARPPRGFTDLGLALRRRGHGALAVRAFRAAAAAKEPDATLELGRERLLEAWSLAAKGERDAAAAALLEAREMLSAADR